MGFFAPEMRRRKPCRTHSFFCARWFATSSLSLIPTRCICPGVKKMTQLEHWKTSFLLMVGAACFLDFLSNMYCHWHLCHLSDCIMQTAWYCTVNPISSGMKIRCQMTKPLSLFDSCDARCSSYVPDAAGNLLDLWLRHLPWGFKSHIMGFPKQDIHTWHSLRSFSSENILGAVLFTSLYHRKEMANPRTPQHDHVSAVNSAIQADQRGEMRVNFLDFCVEIFMSWFVVD